MHCIILFNIKYVYPNYFILYCYSKAMNQIQVLLIFWRRFSGNALLEELTHAVWRWMRFEFPNKAPAFIAFEKWSRIGHSDPGPLMICAISSIEMILSWKYHSLSCFILTLFLLYSCFILTLFLFYCRLINV